MCWICDRMAPKCPHTNAQKFHDALLSLGITPLAQDRFVPQVRDEILAARPQEHHLAQVCQVAEEPKEASPGRAPPAERTLSTGMKYPLRVEWACAADLA